MSTTTSDMCAGKAATTMDSVINSAEHNQKFAKEALERLSAIRDSLLGSRPPDETNKEVSGGSGQLDQLDDTLARAREIINQINTVLTDLERVCNLDIQKAKHV